MNARTTTASTALLAPAVRRWGHPSPAAAVDRRGTPSRPASADWPSPHSIPVPTSAHPTPRAIRVQRSPR